MLFTILLLWRVKKLTEPVIVAAAAVVGLIVFPMIKA
jgi:chromate transporter